MRKIILADSDTNLVSLGEKKYKKEILRFGKWSHDSANNGVLEITKAKALEMVSNFKSKVLEALPIYKGHATNREAERDPSIVAGYIENLEVTDNGIDAVMVLDDNIAGTLGKVYKNVSSAIDENYVDHETGELKGSVLRHVALVIEPYIKKLDPNFVALEDAYQGEVIEINLSNKNMFELEEKTEATVETTTEATVEATTETKEETKVEAETSVEETTEASVETQLAEAKKRQVELEEKLKAVSEERGKLKTESIEREFGVLLSEGKVLPVLKDEVIALLSSESTIMLSDSTEKSTSDLFRAFLSKLPVVVDLAEKGVAPSSDRAVKLTSDEKEAFGFMKSSPEAIEAYLKSKINN